MSFNVLYSTYSADIANMLLGHQGYFSFDFKVKELFIYGVTGSEYHTTRPNAILNIMIVGPKWPLQTIISSFYLDIFITDVFIYLVINPID